MIISELANYGESLVRRGVLPPLGWSQVNVSFAFEIDDYGNLIRIVDLRTQEERNNKTVLIPLECAVPYRPGKHAGTSPYVLADNLMYITGIEGTHSGGKDKAELKNMAFVKLHHEIFDSVQTKKAKSFLKFLDKHTCMESDAQEFKPYEHIWKELNAASNIVFIYAGDGSFIHEDPDIIDAWNNYYRKRIFASSNTKFGQCAVTGEKNIPITRVHPSFIGVPGTLSTGSSLATFRLGSVDYFGKQGGYSAPVSMMAAESYGNALNYLFKSPKHCKTIGNTLYLFWAENEDNSELESEIFSMALFGRQKFLYDSPADDDIYNAVCNVISGSTPIEEFQKIIVDLSKYIYILGLKPHMARLAPVLFEKATLSTFLDNIIQFNEECRIESRYGIFTSTLYNLLERCVDNNGRKIFNQITEEAIINSVINGVQFPHECLSVLLRYISTDCELSPNKPARAAMLKAILLRNGNKETNEAATVSLNESTTPPYILGQLFDCLDSLHQTALNNMNVSIKIRYLANASVRPFMAFPELLKKSEKYISDLKRRFNTGFGNWYENRINELLRIAGGIPQRSFTPFEQGEFYLGYYHAQIEKYKIKGKDKGEEYV